MGNIVFSTKEAIRNFGSSNYQKWYSPKKTNHDNMAYKSLNENGLLDISINPEFRFSKSDNVFNVGSCFARGLEKSLVGEGINVLSVYSYFDDEMEVMEGTTAMGFMNKYNT